MNLNNYESNYNTINRSFLIAQNSDRLKQIIDKNKHINLDQTSVNTILNTYNEIDQENKVDKSCGDNVKSDNHKTESSNNNNNIKLFRDPSNKYPLEISWCFWFFKNNRDNDWKDNLIKLSEINYVEDFWSVYNHLKPIEYLSDGCDYMLFKKDIEPMWEDKMNQNGGRWLINLEKRACSSNYLNTIWLNSLLSLIGSHYDDDEFFYINGVVLSKRFKMNKLALWTRNYENSSVQNKIAKRFKKVLGLNSSIILFEIHKSS